MKETQVAIYGGSEFLDEIQERIAEKSFQEVMKLTGIYDTPLDKYAVMYILGVSSPNTIDRYTNIGKSRITGQMVKLKRYYGDVNKPRYRLGDVMEFKGMR